MIIFDQLELELIPTALVIGLQGQGNSSPLIGHLIELNFTLDKAMEHDP